MFLSIKPFKPDNSVPAAAVCCSEAKAPLFSVELAVEAKGENPKVMGMAMGANTLVKLNNRVVG